MHPVKPVLWLTGCRQCSDSASLLDWRRFCCWLDARVTLLWDGLSSITYCPLMFKFFQGLGFFGFLVVCFLVFFLFCFCFLLVYSQWVWLDFRWLFLFRYSDRATLNSCFLQNCFCARRKTMLCLQCSVLWSCSLQKPGSHTELSPNRNCLLTVRVQKQCQHCCFLCMLL